MSEFLISKWGNEIVDDGITNVPDCVAKYGYRFLSGGEFSFVMCLVSFKYDERNVYPSQQTIAKNMGVHRSQVERWVQSLTKKGLLRVFDRFLEDGTRTSNEYNLSPILNKCLEESRKEQKGKEPKIRRVERKVEKTAEKVPPTKCMDGEKPDETYSIQNVGMDSIQNVGMDSIQNVGEGTTQNVVINKAIESSNVIKQLNNVCSVPEEEQRILDLIATRDDLKTHTKKLLKILNTKKKQKNFNFDVFYKTLEIIDVDIKGYKYLESALMNNLRKGYVNDFSEPKQPKQPKQSKETVPDWFPSRNEPKEEQASVNIDRRIELRLNMAKDDTDYTLEQVIRDIATDTKLSYEEAEHHYNQYLEKQTVKS